jgi:hypothetical protein
MAMKKLVILLCLPLVLSVIVAIPALTAYAQSFTVKIPLTRGPLKQINEYFSTQSITYSDGTILERRTIKGPPKPPPGQLRETVSLPEPMPEMGINTLTVPAFTWVFGCSAVSAGMIAGYYDLNGFPDIYTGPTNDGEIPLVEDPVWGNWKDSAGDVYPNNPLIASHQGLDGWYIFGSIDDYWVSYLSNASDPYITGNWTQHTWGDAVGDYMKTSQSAYDNVDGSTSFYVNNSATPLSCAVMESSGIAEEDGTYGRKLFYEARGYTVTDCYTQLTDNKRRGGFSFAQYEAEIDAGRPVLLNLQGHSIVGVGYDDSTNTVYIHDTWDHNDHTMRWGGKYAGMTLWGVSIVNIQESIPDTPDISVSPNSYDFGNVNISNTSTQTFTISNAGSANLMIGIISIQSQTSDFSLNQDNCTNKTIAPSSSCTFKVEFSPQSAGYQSATVNIPSNDPDENPFTVTLTGTGITPPKPDLSGNWSSVSKTVSKRGVYTVSGTFTTTNTGSMNANNVVVNFYLSDKSNLSDASNKTLIKTYTYRIITAGSSKTTTIRFSTSLDPGGNYLIADIDPSNNIAESDESNNTPFVTIP